MKFLREKFVQKVNFVKPLYRKVRIEKRVNPTKKVFTKNSINASKQSKLCGNGVSVKREIVKNVKTNVINVVSGRNTSVIDRTLEVTSVGNKSVKKADFATKFNDIECEVTYKYDKQDIMNDNLSDSKSVQAENGVVVIHKSLDTWLRVYPARQTPDESTWSIVMRCAVCQLGLATILVLWTFIWVFLIHYIEGPYETDVAVIFEREQNQLVIDLATELRQITPLSKKWKNAIERRIEDERLLTMRAVAQGAKINPGHFWNLSGTFLFTVYVMTALGFGAPVPQTKVGRTCGLVYAAIAVPTHFFLMMNASTCLIVHMEPILNKIRSDAPERKQPNPKTMNFNADSPNHSRNSEVIKTNRSVVRSKLRCIARVLTVGRCIPMVTILYYTLGAISFGVLRHKESLETLMFPLEFTTTGGLEHVESHVRVIYGFYVEGAMSLLACALATIRRHSSTTITQMSEKHRLLTIEK